MTTQRLYLCLLQQGMYLFVALATSMARKVCCPHETGSGEGCKQLTSCGVCGAAGVNANSAVGSHR